MSSFKHVITFTCRHLAEAIIQSILSWCIHTVPSKCMETV
uniref:Uncharacterized protein n=1 Tax=Anguilla anguilla TaxID=7936 RepID=A0A0E9Q7S0_ANGAN